MSRLINLELAELNLSEKEGYEYGCAMFEQLPDIYVDTSKDKSAPRSCIKYKFYHNEGKRGKNKEICQSEQKK